MKVGIQMYSVKQEMAKDPVATMRKVAEIGYKYWETCELFGSDCDYNYGLCMPADEGKALIDELGVKIIGCHLSNDCMANNDSLVKFLDYQAAVGCENPGLAMDFFPDMNYIQSFAANLNRVGRMCKDRGMGFHYHNHFQEFQKIDGKYVIDWILELTDPGLVDFELDTFWAMRGGVDPVAMIERYKDRLVMLHQKDFAKDAEQQINLFNGVVDPNVPVTREDFGKSSMSCFTEVGTGIMDIQGIIDTANTTHIKYITLEQDYTRRSEFESIAMSMEAFKKYHGVEWD